MGDRVVSITDGALTTTVDNIEHIESQSLSLAENPRLLPPTKRKGTGRKGKL
jgi:hypothetical protein